ncbi:NAD(+) synthase [Phycisphaeraceae bacterium D3-23]
MKLFRVAAAAVNQTPLDWDNNAANLRAAMDDARECGASLLCLPELCITGYGCEDAFCAPSTRRMARRVLAELLPATRGIVVTLGLPVMHEGALLNACVCVVDGKVAGVVPKQHLAGDGLHYEPRWFKPWPQGAVTRVDWDGGSVPMGDLVFDLAGVRVGFEICEDAWVARRPGASLVDRAVDIILNPSASHFAFGKQAIRQRIVADASRAFGVTYLYSNLVGNEAGRAIYDGGTLIAAGGRLVAQGPRFSYQARVVTDAVVDIDATRMQRAQRTSTTPIADPGAGVVEVGFALADAPPVASSDSPAGCEYADACEEEAFTRAIALALFDYARKSRSMGYVVSLSGGADSTAVACLVRLMVDLGRAELGAEAFAQRIGLAMPGADAGSDTYQLLTTCYQGTRNSSATTRDAAQAVADAIGARHLVLDIDALNTGYIDLIESAIGRTLTWESDDIALQNIQARVRAPGVWMLANLESKILAATSNRSEAAVGYTTMDGDTCGGISPIAGIDKAFLRRWLTWLELQGPTGIGPIPAVAAVNRLVPTAELRPQDQGQTDEDDLMPYEVLDAIEHQAIGEKRSPAEALADLSARFPQYPHATMSLWVERFFALWSRNQWKRERFAPSFHVDDKNLDPKTWCRFPILSGGYRRELRELGDAGGT